MPIQLDNFPPPVDAPDVSYRIGVVGAGGIVEESHLPAYRGKGWEVVRIASRTEESAARVAEKFDIPAATDRLLDVIEDPAVEVVDISLPPHLHREICMAAFEAGKHVLVQKPITPSLREATEICDAADRAGVHVAVNQNGRWDPAIRACQHLLREGSFGSVVTASMELRTRQPWQSFWEDAEHYPRLMMLGMSIHHLDQFRFMFGDPVSVTAVTQTYPGQPWVGDSIAFYALRYSDQFVAYGFDDGFPWTPDWSVRYRIEGLDAIARGEIGWPTGSPSTLEVAEASDDARWQTAQVPGRWFPDAFAGTMGALFTTIATGVPSDIAGRENLKTMRLVEAAYLSAAERRTVDLKEIAL